jgi:phage terminase Nu1 subunit (DNA packaging protein)
MKKKLTTNREVAKHLDVTEQYISKLKKEGVLPNADGRKGLNIDEARLAYIHYLRAKLRLNPKGFTDTSIAEEKVRLTKAQADLKEMEVELLNGGMLKAEEVVEGWIGFVSNARAKLLNLPSKVAHQVIGLETYGDAEEIIRLEIYEVLNELSKSEIPDSLRMGVDGDSKDIPTTDKNESVGVGGQAQAT